MDPTTPYVRATALHRNYSNPLPATEREKVSILIMPQRFAALDLHKKEIEACILDLQGNVLHRARFAATRESITNFAITNQLSDCAVALEATTNTWPVTNILQPLCSSLTVSNPLRTKAIAQAKIKTDKVDSLVLAQLLRTDFLPEVWIPDPTTRRMRDLTTQRAMLVSDRTRIKNRIHAILHQRLIPTPASGDLFSTANLDWLRSSISIDEDGREALDCQLRLLDLIESEIQRITAKLAKLAWRDPQVKLLMTLPGVDFTVAQAILATFGDVSRFDSADKAAAYLGLVPSTRQSGDHCYHGRITKQGNSHARWLMVQAAQHLDSHPGPLGHFFRKISHRKNRNVAVVASARKLVTIAWHMLKNNEPYRYAQSRNLDEKFRRLRVLATGGRRKTGPKKGQPRSTNRGTGLKTRAIYGLDSIYADAGLPLIQPLKPGEEKLLRETGSLEFAAEVRTDRRIEKKSGGKPGRPRKVS